MSVTVWLPEGIPTWDVDYLVPAKWNPNKQTDRVFKNLVDAIRQVGFLEPVVAAPVPEENWEEYLTPEQYAEGIEKYRLIVGGKHRWEAAKVLDMPRVPIVFKEEFTEDVVKLQNMRLNATKGEIDPEKFQHLYYEMLNKGYEEEVLQAQMGVVEAKNLKRLLKETKANLPAGLREKFDSMSDGIQSVDDLQRILNELFSTHGDTLPYSFMIFDFGGKTVAWVQLDKNTLKAVQSITQFCYDRHLDVNRAFAHLLKGAREKLLEDEESLLAEADEGVSYE